MKNSILSPENSLWYKDAVVYQLHVKGFFDSNADGIGDFPGLLRKLDYIQALGVNCLWLLPFYPSPLRDDGYDISDYRGVHPAYGTLKDFRAFLREAHRRGMKVVTELVINHTSDQHPWFQAARAAPAGSAARNFYVWSDTQDRYRDARIIFTDSETSNWTWDAKAGAYFWHRFFHHQPDLNYDNPAVLRAIKSVMRYWLDMGVDGLRLDAVPYLVEREGTSCENLPETHAVLKELRRFMDKNFKDRLFLAEANQWPSDVRAYFGDGDECHMAFHFPLMPRLFMALRQEDRHPVTEVINQTPPIPEVCQWAIFLRNHDELTLEMVTSEERDYMFSQYAADPQMRVNIGIRRRLAPLMDHSRPRLQLLNSILLSFGGTPILYYGDEIGMGDNVFLGDRNGVRTPMQWTGDRNAGFSQADPARLYNPPIMDPVYGYMAINVESQERDPSSLLHWTRRMIALRRRFGFFGRGTFSFLYPANRKILAYTRRKGDEIFLAVANLSRFVQPVELDLAEFKGMWPMEMMGGVEFPSIGDLPYFLTLGPHGFYWFQLRRHPAAIASSESPEGDIRPAPAVDCRSLAEFPDAEAVRALESRVFPKQLPFRPWFDGKGQTIAGLKILDWARIPGEARAFWFVVEARLADGSLRAFSVPLVLVSGTAAEDWLKRPGIVWAEIQSPQGRGVLVDAAESGAFCRDFYSLLRAPRAIQGQKGVFQPFTSGGFDPGAAPFQLLSPGAANHRYSFVFYDQKAILKMYRRLDPGPDPDMEMSLFLTEKAGFSRVPSVWGGLTFLPAKGEAMTVAMLQTQITHQGDGWAGAQNELSLFFERASIRREPPTDTTRWADVPGKGEIPEDVRETVGAYLKTAEILGRRTGEMHRALASDLSDPGFAPEPMPGNYMSDAVERLRQQVKHSFRLLEVNVARLTGDIRDEAYELLGTRARILASVQRPEGGTTDVQLIRCHGDYHLGRVLWEENDFMILGFEGAAGRSLADRRQKDSPLRDVAGMIGSIHFAAAAGLLAAREKQPEAAAGLAPWARLWENWVSGAFLSGYRAATGEAPFLPSDGRAFSALLRGAVLEGALRELNRALAIRPDGADVAIKGLLAIVKTLHAMKREAG